MKQPELGKHIAKLRISKGLTQDELVAKCNISVRTLQRIESGKVMPRSYTLKIIAIALECEPFYTADKNGKKTGRNLSPSFKRIYKYLKDLFNLKTHTMKKVSILTTATLIIGFSFYTVGSTCYAQERNKIDYVIDNTSGFQIQLPRGLPGYGNYICNDTAMIRAGKDLLKEYKGVLFLNNDYVGQIDKGDTIIYKKSSLFRKKSVVIKPYVQRPSFTSDGIIFITPPVTTLANDGKGEVFVIGKNKIRHHNNQIYLDDTYIGDALPNDTVILRQGELFIKKYRNK